MISIIIPAYNREKYIGQCIRSAQNQTYRDIEIIVVDDGSADSTGATCDALAVADRRIRVIHQANGGVSAARQAGIDCSGGQWICFLDSDDTLPENALEAYSQLIEDNPDIIVSGHPGNLDKQQFLLGIMDYSICPALWGKLFRADFLKKHIPILPRGLVVGEDMIANLVVGLEATTIGTTDRLLYNVTMDNCTSVMKTFRKKFEYENFFFRELDELFLSNCKHLPYYRELVRNSVFLKLNGYKTVVLHGNLIDTESDEWQRFLLQIRETGLRLGPSDKLFLKMQHCQKLYGIIMNLYLKLRK